jgi:hypothetical protein
VTEFPHDETATAVALQTGALGNIRTTTMKAFDAEQMSAIIQWTGEGHRRWTPTLGSWIFAATTGMAGAGSPTGVLHSGSPPSQGRGCRWNSRDPAPSQRHGTCCVKTSTAVRRPATTLRSCSRPWRLLSLRVRWCSLTAGHSPPVRRLSVRLASGWTLSAVAVSGSKLPTSLASVHGRRGGRPPALSLDPPSRLCGGDGLIMKGVP